MRLYKSKARIGLPNFWPTNPAFSRGQLNVRVGYVHFYANAGLTKFFWHVHELPVLLGWALNNW
jgi:hypothetical protein